jgi:hypothetical protein
MGLGMWLHELSLALFLAAWLSAIPLQKSHRYMLPGLAIGFFSVVGLWGVFNWSVYGIVEGPHLSANILQNNSDHRFDLGSILDLFTFVERAMIELTGTTALSGQNHLFWWFILFAFLLVIYATASSATKYSATIYKAVPLLGLAAGTVALFLSLEGYAGTNNGLFQATPVLIPALMLPCHIRDRQAPFSPSSTFYSWMGCTCFLFILFVLINPMLPGTDWGSRYLLTVLPLLALLAAYSLEQQYRQPGRWRQIVIASVVWLVAVSFVSQCTGFVYIRRSLTYNRQLNKYVKAINAHVLVTDSLSVGPIITNLPTSQKRFLVRSDDDEKQLAVILRRMDVDNFVYLSTLSHASELESYISHGDHVFVQVDSRPLWHINADREEGPEVMMVQFVREKG